MYPRLFILAVTALLLILETTFLPCDYVNDALPSKPDAGYHTLSHFNTEIVLDLDALVYEVGITIVFAAIALALAPGPLGRLFARPPTPRTWRTQKLSK